MLSLSSCENEQLFVKFNSQSNRSHVIMKSRERAYHLDFVAAAERSPPRPLQLDRSRRDGPPGRGARAAVARLGSAGWRLSMYAVDKTSLLDLLATGNCDTERSANEIRTFPLGQHSPLSTIKLSLAIPSCVGTSTIAMVTVIARDETVSLRTADRVTRTAGILTSSVK